MQVTSRTAAQSRPLTVDDWAQHASGCMHWSETRSIMQLNAIALDLGKMLLTLPQPQRSAQSLTWLRDLIKYIGSQPLRC